MFTAKVYRIMVGSLSGAMEEVYVAKETIRKWNQQNSEGTGKVFMPIKWNSTPEAIQNVDVVVGIVDNWVAEEKVVEDSIAAGKQVMLFFKAVQDSTNTIHREFMVVQLFRKRNHAQCYCVEYNGLTELGFLLKDRLEAY